MEMTNLDERQLSCVSLPTERMCFICLDGTESDSDPLVPCCTRCYAVSHDKCWADWRSSQAGHARRLRLAGNRITADPFLCSICKSGSARVGGERVTIRWLESFANFGRSASAHQVRFATGLFSALTNARNETRTSSSDEEDFFEFMDSEVGNGNSSFLCGNSKKFILINLLILTIGCIASMTISELGLVDGSILFLTGWIVFYVYLVILVGYGIWRFQTIMTRRAFTEEGNFT
jgi:hypothetical protein